MRRRRTAKAAAAGVLLLCLAGLPAPAGARGAPELVSEGNQALGMGLIPPAIARYASAREKAGEPAVPLFNMGVALVRQENYPAALAAFQSIERPGRETAPLVHYNQGNVLARLGQMVVSEDPQAALDLYIRSTGAYGRALRLEPTLEPAAYNLEIVRTWIAELTASADAGAGGGQEADEGEGEAGESRQAPAPGDGQGDQPGDGSPSEGSPEEPQAGQAQPGGGAAPDSPWAQRDETAQSILEEERRRREGESSWGGGESSDGRPNW